MPTQPALVAIDGPSAGKRWPFEVGKNVTIGRVDQATIIVRDDPLLSNLHFALEWQGDVCMVRDLNSKFGIMLNGVNVKSAEIHDGDRIKAGRSEFTVTLAPVPHPDTPDPVSLSANSAESEGASSPRRNAPSGGIDLLACLRGQKDLVALVDGARDRSISLRLLEYKDQCQSLYEGPRGDALAMYGPYLVKFGNESPLLESLVADGWGKAWGVYLTTAAPITEVRAHFRRFLEVRLPNGREAYFRFYDPRVLRLYLPTCTEEERKRFFGPVQRFLCESVADDQMLVFAQGSAVVHSVSVNLDR